MAEHGEQRTGEHFQPELEGFSDAYIPSPADADPRRFHRVVCLLFAGVMTRRAKYLESQKNGRLEDLLVADQHRTNALELIRSAAVGLGEPIETEVAQFRLPSLQYKLGIEKPKTRTRSK